MCDLRKRLIAAIDHEDDLARRARKGPWTVNHTSDMHLLHDGDREEIAETPCWLGDDYAASYAHMALHDPIHIGHKVSAARMILSYHEPCQCPTPKIADLHCPTVLALGRMFRVQPECGR